MPQDGRQLPCRLGRYRLLESLGTGTQGAVYLAELEAELGFRRKVAIKIVGEGTGRVERAVKSLANEARALAAAHHPNVVQVHDLARIEGEYLLVMEFVDGPTLSQVVRKLALNDSTMPLGDVLLVAERIAEGLACVHGLMDPQGEPAPIIHRDLKPSNVIISQHGVPKIVDFGLAKGKLVAFHTLVPNITRGTPGYMSPEQVRGEALTPASDQFALGTIIYEMATNQPLFHDRSEVALMRRVAEGRPTSNPEMLRRICPDLFPLVVRCLSVDPAGRFAETSQLADQLRSLRQHLGLASDLGTLVTRGGLPSPGSTDLAMVLEQHALETNPLEGIIEEPGTMEEPDFFDLPADEEEDEDLPPMPRGGLVEKGAGTEMFFFGDDREAPDLAGPEPGSPPAVFGFVDTRPPQEPPERADVGVAPYDADVPSEVAEWVEDNTPRQGVATTRKPTFRDLMSHDVSFRLEQPKGKTMKFSRPKTEIHGPSQFDMDPVVAEPRDDDEESSDEPLPPWEIGD